MLKLESVARRIAGLPPANEVWGKVIFSKVSVILFTKSASGRGHVCLKGWSASSGSAYRGGMHLGGGALHPGGLGRPPGLHTGIGAVRILLECFLVVGLLMLT